MTTPLLSVVIASYNSRATLPQCLRSLESQLAHDGFDVEVIVVDSSDDDTAAVVRRQFPWVKLYSFSRRLFPGDARNIGAAHAQGQILAFTDTDCIAAPDWLDRLARAHQMPYAVIGGVVDNARPHSGVGWANYFCEYAQWMPQLHQRPMTDLPGACLSVKRWALERYGPFLEDTYCSDTAFNWRATRDGHDLLFLPSVRVAHISQYTLVEFLKKKYMHGRAFACVRRAEEAFSIGRSLLYALGAPVLPLLLFLRRLGNVLSAGHYALEFTLAAPMVFLGLAAWSLGEFHGYLSALTGAARPRVGRSPSERAAAGND